MSDWYQLELRTPFPLANNVCLSNRLILTSKNSNLTNRHKQVLISVRMTTSVEETFMKNLARIAVTGRPREDIVYGVFSDFVILHKIPPTRFTIYPQMSLKWKPADERDRRQMSALEILRSQALFPRSNYDAASKLNVLFTK